MIIVEIKYFTRQDTEKYYFSNFFLFKNKTFSKVAIRNNSFVGILGFTLT